MAGEYTKLFNAFIAGVHYGRENPYAEGEK